LLARVVPVAVVAGLIAVFGLPSVAAADCGSPANPVVAENCLPGTPQSQWDISGAGSQDIQGFATDISANAGSTIHFKIDTPATAYRLDIYRMGYYGGDGARLIQSVTPPAGLLPQNQPACVTTGASGLIDCGNWATSASWDIPATAVSGVYFAHVVRTDAVAGESHIVFVVRNDGGSSGVFFQTSDTTWQAYNQYGGNSLYVGGPGSDPGRAYKVSYNRPVTTRQTSPEDSVFNAEYPMIRWLERNGYDVSYTTGVDSDRRGALIRNHRVFLSVGHDEYWSATQRANVEAARNAGVNLAFLSGNEVFWKTRWEGDRTLVTYKETHQSAKLDPLANVWTGSWRDPRPFNPEGGQPENALTGTLFTVNSGDRALAVPPADGALRLWRGSGVASEAAAGRTATLTQSSVGYEWDEDVDNGARPAGLVRLSTTTGNGVEVLEDFGLTYANGNATHHVTLYRDTNGAGPDALVFGAGTVQWSWGLDSDHDRGSPAPDASMKQATVNLLADMGTQPGSLEPGLSTAAASADAQAPSTSITSPAGGATVAAGSPVTVTGTAADVGGRVGAVEVSVDGGSSWHPATGRESWSYSFTPSVPGQTTLLSRAADDSANLGAPASVTVNVPVKTCPCTLFGDATPATTANEGVGLELGVRFTPDGAGRVTALRYYSAGGSGQRLGHLWTASGTQLAEVAFPAAQGWHEVALPTPVAVTGGTTYIASFYAADGTYGYTDNFFLTPYDAAPLRAPASGNGAYVYAAGGGFPNTPSGNATNYFADVAFVGDDHTAPHVADVSPADGATGVDPGTSVTARFDEAVEPSSVTAATFQLRDGTGAAVPAAVSYSAATRTATLRPQSALARSITYTAVVKGGAGGVRDTSANALAQDRAWSFTTVLAPGGGGANEGGSSGGSGSGPGGGAGSPGGGAAAQGPSVRVTPTTVRVSRSGTVRLRVSCPRPAGRCRVTLRLTLKRKLAATRTITVTGGRSTSVTLKLSRAARRALARTASLPAVVTAVARDQADRTKTTRTSIRLRAPRS
jgi:N,N-dimethylformamidase beta subunit-like, C-terminal/Domain of unknown function (DUF4082)/Bacterial Ig-like domain/Bacterial Ig domain